MGFIMEYVQELNISCSAPESIGKVDEDKGILLTANVGSKMRLGNVPVPVVIDMNGVRFNKENTAVIYQHDTEKPLGKTEEQFVLKAGESREVNGKEVHGPGIYSRARITCKNSLANQVKENIYEDLFSYEVSVGAFVEEYEVAKPGERLEANGNVYEYPVAIARKSVIREYSICVNGADPSTSVIAATANNKLEIKQMEESLKTYIEAKGFNVEGLTEAQEKYFADQMKIEASAKSSPQFNADEYAKQLGDKLKAEVDNHRKEIERQDLIQASAVKYSDVTDVSIGNQRFDTVIKAKEYAIENGINADTFEVAVLKAAVEKNNGAAKHVKSQSDVLDNQILACAMLREAGIPEKTDRGHGLSDWYNDKVLEASDNKRLRGIGFHQLMDYQMVACSGQYSFGNYNRDFISDVWRNMKEIRASGSGATTINISQIWEDVANKVLVSSFELANTTWEGWCKVVSTKDFKPSKFYTFDTLGQLEPIGNAGQFRHGDMEEGKFTISTESYGKILGFTRQTLINDDMGVILDAIKGLASMAATTIEEAVYVTHLENLSTTFTSAKGNIVTGASYALSLEGLDKAWDTFQNRVDSTGRPLNVVPDILLCGQNQRITAQELYNKAVFIEGLGSTANANKKVPQTYDNPYKGLLRPIYSQYISNTACRQGVYARGASIPNQTQTGYWLIANPAAPQGAYMYVSFLNGNRTPFLERDEDDFETLGMKARVYTDFGVSIGRPEMAVYMTGANA